MNLFVGEQSVRDLETPVADGTEIFIVGALSGGSGIRTGP
jgi:molybdopterin converting factor small subunit